MKTSPKRREEWQWNECLGPHSFSTGVKGPNSDTFLRSQDIPCSSDVCHKGSSDPGFSTELSVSKRNLEAWSLLSGRTEEQQRQPSRKKTDPLLCSQDIPCSTALCQMDSSGSGFSTELSVSRRNLEARSLLSGRTEEKIREVAFRR